MTTVSDHPDLQCREPDCTKPANPDGRCYDCYRAKVQAAKVKGAATRLANTRAHIERQLADGARIVYLDRILPADHIPDGVVVVHNHVQPRRRLGVNGFRAWVQTPDDRLAVCGCGWAPEVGVHYRIRP